MATAPKVQLGPITDADLPGVGAFLHAEMNSRVSAQQWVDALTPAWQVDPPNHGFQLRSNGEVVGAYLALYSTREVAGTRERFCNLAAWCVREEFRFSSVRLLKALLAQDGYHFTDLSPSGNVVALNRRLNFRPLDTATALVANLPWPTRPRACRVVSERSQIASLLTGADLEIHRDHADAAAARHVVLVDGDQHCYVVFRRDRRKGLPLFANLLFVSNPELLRRRWHHLARHLLVRHRLPVTLMEPRVSRFRAQPSIMLKSPRLKMYRSHRLTDDQIDYLYSELVAVAW